MFEERISDRLGKDAREVRRADFDKEIIAFESAGRLHV
jgi:hypothetical protein